MKKGPQRDWAERAAHRLCEIHTVSSDNSPCPSCVRIVLALRRAEKQGIIWAYNHYEQAELLVSGELSWAARERERSEG